MGGLNLHAIVRGSITAVNGDIAGLYLKSTGASPPQTGGKRVPVYATPVNVQLQIQPPSGEDLKHINYLNLQGVVRTIYLYSNPQGIVRVDARGGDLLLFPQFLGDPVDNWLVRHVYETWNVDNDGWTRLIATLQTDRPSS